MHTDVCGEPLFSFPSFEELKDVGEEALNVCRGGYRCAYIGRTVKAVACGSLDLSALFKGTESAVEE